MVTLPDVFTKAYAAVQFLCRLVSLYELQPFSVSSWLRTPTHNAAVGGHPESLHLAGLAADLVPDNHGTIETLASHAKACGLHYEVADDHLHVQVFPKGHQLMG